MFLDKSVRFYKSSTLGQLTGRNTPVWCPSPEPIDFEQRRSGEDGRFSWENIRPEHEVAIDRMNLWIQSVESKFSRIWVEMGLVDPLRNRGG